MKKTITLPIFMLTAIIFIVSAACLTGSSLPAEENSPPQATEPAPPPTQLPAPTESEPEAAEPTALPPTELPAPTEPPAPTEAPSQDPVQPKGGSEPCTEDVCIEQGSFVLSRPLAPTGRNTIDSSYRYGDYRHNMGLTHHGVDFLNSTGTSVVAAADGVVVVAGDDLEIPYGPRKDYYGNLVILEHALPGISEPVFTLYSQLSEVLVGVGDSVAAGQEIGLVGMTGVVPGSTLHFEVRVGANSLQEARNPELWLQLLSNANDQPLGALAGRIVDADGIYQPVDNIVVEQLAGPGLPAIDQFYLTTYEKDELRGKSPWNESFALSDLPSGDYQITFYLNGEQQREITVEPGMLTLVTFVVDLSATN